MKKIFIALGLILVIAGIVIVGVFGGAKGFTDWEDFRLHDLSKADDTFEFSAEDIEELEKIEVQADQFFLYVVESDSAEKLSVKFVSNLPKEVNLSVVRDEKTLKITQTMERSHKLSVSIWNCDFLKFFVVIQVPKTDAFKNLEIDVNVKHGGMLFVDDSLQSLVKA